MVAAFLTAGHGGHQTVSKVILLTFTSINRSLLANAREKPG